MSSLRRNGGGKFPPPGLKGYPLDKIYEEVAFIAYYFHWSEKEILQLPHWERKEWCEKISNIHQKSDKKESNAISLGDL
ncbi:DUF6760 family protein [Sulfurovum sp.]|uniref:DUF6760 family protein n=1 Tax=Sulfurovum sp. TaxID=1969726 RepID=UPI00345829E9